MTSSTTFSPMLALISHEGVFQTAWSAGEVQVAHVEWVTSEGPLHPVMGEDGHFSPARVRTQIQSADPQRLEAWCRCLPEAPRSEPETVGPSVTRVIVFTRGGLIQDVWADRPLRLLEVDQDLRDLDPDLESQLVQPTAHDRPALADWATVTLRPQEVAASYAEWTRPTSMAAPLRRRPSN